MIQRLIGEVEIVGCVDEKLNIFQAKRGGTTLTARQPRRKDLSGVRKALKKVSERNWRRFVTLVELDNRNWSKYLCKQPLFRHGMLGKMPLIMEINGRIVGFGGMLFQPGKTFTMHDIPDPDALCVYPTLLVIDEYQGRGIGTLFAYLTQFIAAHFKAEWMIGNTYVEGGTYHMRQKMNWEMLGILTGQPGGAMILMRKRLNQQNK